MSLARIQSYPNWLDALESQISQTTTAIQSEGRSCCVYAVPETLINTNGTDVYRPRVISIGPLHCSDDQVRVVNEYKLEFLKRLLSRKALRFEDLTERIDQFATEARECYSREINLESFDNNQFLKMMVLDGCFLLELFLNADQILSEFNNLAGAVSYIYRDLLLLENQIPFSFLENLFQTLNYMPVDTSDCLSLLALRFFNRVMRRPDGVIEKFLRRQNDENEPPLHLLDLVRSSLRVVPPETTPTGPTACRLIHSISKLRRAGIKLKQRKAESFLDVKFRNGVIQMPNIIMDYNMKTFLLNCLAFEHLHNCRSKHFTVYASFLDCIVDTTGDVGQLCERGIFNNYFGDYKDVAKFINNMTKDLWFNYDQFYLSHLFKQVDDRYHNSRKVQWTSFKRRYCNTPWTFISALAALVLLALTFLQTFYTIYAYVNPKP